MFFFLKRSETRIRYDSVPHEVMTSVWFRFLPVATLCHKPERPSLLREIKSDLPTLFFHEFSRIYCGIYQGYYNIHDTTYITIKCYLNLKPVTRNSNKETVYPPTRVRRRKSPIFTTTGNQAFSKNLSTSMTHLT